MQLLPLMLAGGTPLLARADAAPRHSGKLYVLYIEHTAILVMMYIHKEKQHIITYNFRFSNREKIGVANQQKISNRQTEHTRNYTRGLSLLSFQLCDHILTKKNEVSPSTVATCNQCSYQYKTGVIKIEIKTLPETDKLR